MATKRRPPKNAPGVAFFAKGLATLAKSIWSGSDPKRERAWKIALGGLGSVQRVRALGVDGLDLGERARGPARAAGQVQIRAEDDEGV